MAIFLPHKSNESTFMDQSPPKILLNSTVSSFVVTLAS